MEKAEGEAHQPSFVFTVKLGEITCTGSTVAWPWAGPALTRPAGIQGAGSRQLSVGCSVVICVVSPRWFLPGRGHSKKAAKHLAAAAALSVLRIDAENLWVKLKLLFPLRRHRLSWRGMRVVAPSILSFPKSAPADTITRWGVFVFNPFQLSCPNRNVPVKSDSNEAAAEADNHPNSVGTLQVRKSTDPLLRRSRRRVTSPTALVQELALHRGWRLPEYAVLMEAGPPHKREFTVSCRLESLSEAGTTDSGAFG